MICRQLRISLGSNVPKCAWSSCLQERRWKADTGWTGCSGTWTAFLGNSLTERETLHLSFKEEKRAKCECQAPPSTVSALGRNLRAASLALPQRGVRQACGSLAARASPRHRGLLPLPPPGRGCRFLHPLEPWGNPAHPHGSPGPQVTATLRVPGRATGRVAPHCPALREPSTRCCPAWGQGQPVCQPPLPRTTTSP